MKVRVSSECVWRLSRAKNVSVTAALCFCLARVTPVTQTFPSSLLAVLSHCSSSGSQSPHKHQHAHQHTHTHTHTISLSFSVSGPGNKLRVSLSRPRRCQNRTTRTAALSSLCQPRLLMFAAVPPLGTAVHPSAPFGGLLSNGTRERLN